MTQAPDTDAKIATIKATAESAHKRLDEHTKEVDSRFNRQNKEILSLRDSRHELNTMTQIHDCILTSIKRSMSILADTVKEQAKATSDNTKTLDEFKTMAATAIYMGAGFITFCVFVGGKILKWW